jgi:peptide/nickel transport system permease protein
VTTLRAGLVLLSLLAAIAIAAPWLLTADPNAQRDPAAARLLPPGSTRVLVSLKDGTVRIAESTSSRASGLTYTRLGIDHELAIDQLAEPPRSVHFRLGTDQFGRDVAARLLIGARVSLAIGALATVLAIALGIAVGSLAALGGPIADMVLMRLTEALMAFPRLLLILVASTLWRLDLVALVLLLGTTSWMETARLTRAQVLHELRAGYVEAAIVSGLPRGRILLRHLLPNALSPLLADAALRVGDVILLEAALSYLGFGVPVPTASWGRMVADGEELFESAWWLATLPGICIVAAVLGFTLIADGLRDRLDPTLAEAK